MSNTEITSIKDVTIYGSGIWLEMGGQEWLIISSFLEADLYKVARYVNRMVLEKYASINISGETKEDEIIAGLFSKIFPPRNNKQEEQLGG
jgi:hypothetical protein